MKREIKFRAWLNNQMVYDAENIPGIFCGDDPVMQFTGLTDKNRKEVYEGDIIRIHVSEYLNEYGKKSDYVIETDLTSWGFETDWKHIDGSGYNCSTHIMRDNPINYEVIGNIYENPELLK